VAGRESPLTDHENNDTSYWSIPERTRSLEGFNDWALEAGFPGSKTKKARLERGWAVATTNCW